MGKNTDNIELIIGIVFILVLGGGLFSILINNSLPGAENDPVVRVKDKDSANFDFDTSVNSSGTLNTASQTNKNSAATKDGSGKSLILDQEDSILNSNSNNNNSNSGEIKQYAKPPLNVLKEGATYQATLKTSQGDIKIDLNAEQTPNTVNNFVFLANDGFYDGTRSHRIIKGFMVQFGDPLTKDTSYKNMWGTGNPGYKFADEDFEGSYERGTVAMANSGPNTNGSQFFIMHQTTPLPPSYVIFGKVNEEASLEVLDAIANTPVVRSPSGEQSLPSQDVIINSVEISEQ